MTRRIATIAASAALLLGLVARPAAAARPSTPDTACLQAGLGVLRSGALGVSVDDVARDGLLGLSLDQVLRAHLFQPELFSGGPGSVGDWCG
jgi:hypothetical protein